MARSLAIRKTAPWPFVRIRPKDERLFAFFMLRRDIFFVAAKLNLDIRTDYDDLDGFFQAWAQTGDGIEFLFARYRPSYISLEDRTTWVSRPADQSVTLFARWFVEERIDVFEAVTTALELGPDDVVFLDDDEQVVPRPDYIPPIACAERGDGVSR